MIADALGAWSLRLLDLSWQAGLLAAAAWTLCRLCPRMPAQVRAALWWLVCAKFLVGLIWTQPVAVPWLPAGLGDAMAAGTDYLHAVAASWTTGAAVTAGTAGAVGTAGTAGTVVRSAGADGAASSTVIAARVAEPVHAGPPAESTRRTAPAPATFGASATGTSTAGASATPTPMSRAWSTGEPLLPWLGALWLCGVLLQLALMWRAWRRTRTLVRLSTPADATVAALAEAMCQRVGVGVGAGVGVRAGIGGVPVRLSAAIDTPRVTGALAPTILLPAAAQPLSRADLEMTLCHELLHVRRGDLILGWLPSLAQALFFFHPCAWMAAREYALAREAACDAAVLRLLDAEPDAYGALLLRLGITHGDIAPVAVGASSSFRTLKRRLIMLQHTSEQARAQAARWWIVAAVAALAIIPLRLVAQSQTEPQKEPQKETRTATTSVGRGTSSAPDRSQSTSEAEMKRTHLAAATRDAWVLVHDGDNVTMSGRMEDVAEAKRLRGSSGGSLLWFRHAGKAYVIRDAATLADVETLFAPMRELGEQQGALGEEQGKLGTSQSKLGSQQGQLGGQMGELSAKLTFLTSQQLELTAKQLRNGNVARADLERQQAEIEGQVRKISEQITELGRRQEELGRQQEALGRDQEHYGRKQEALGMQQEAASKQVEQQLRELLERALATGRAEPVR